jgi:phosphatidylethanolamine-binding protein (PEBP) family uncharacterized protein
LTEADGSAPKGLDECRGHDHDGPGYHYHAAEKYPYVLGGFHGEVVEAEGQVDPQPRAQGVREALQALRGAEITGFGKTGENAYQLNYSVDGEPRAVRYRIGEDGTFPFEFDNGREGTTREVYRVRGGGAGGPPGGGGDRPPRGGGGGGPEMRPPGGGRRPDPLLSVLDTNADGYLDREELDVAEERLKTLDRNGDGRLDREEAIARPPGGGNRGGGGGMEVQGPGRMPAPGAGSMTAPTGGLGAPVDGFALSSPEIGEDGRLPVEFTGDGAGVSPPLSWQGAPVGTKSYALIMDHLAPGDEMKSYWVMWDIPAEMTRLPRDASETGRVGVGFRGEVGYEPPHSQGPGDKTYVLHLYALSDIPEPAGPAGRVSREALLEAMEGTILARADLSVVYARAEGATGSPRGGKGGPRP